MSFFRKLVFCDFKVMMGLKLVQILQQIDALNFIDFLHEVTTLMLKKLVELFPQDFYCIYLRGIKDQKDGLEMRPL